MGWGKKEAFTPPDTDRDKFCGVTAVSFPFPPLRHCGKTLNHLLLHFNPHRMADQNETVQGVDLRPRLQCAHWHSDRDIIAIKHRCCGVFYACISCHEELAGHAAAVWPRSERTGVKVVLCGSCRHEMTAEEYLACGNVCPLCAAAFNPGCALHYDLYFEME